MVNEEVLVVLSVDEALLDILRWCTCQHWTTERLLKPVMNVWLNVVCELLMNLCLHSSEHMDLQVFSEEDRTYLWCAVCWRLPKPAAGRRWRRVSACWGVSDPIRFTYRNLLTNRRAETRLARPAERRKIQTALWYEIWMWIIRSWKEFWPESKAFWKNKRVSTRTQRVLYAELSSTHEINKTVWRQEQRNDRRTNESSGCRDLD